jgi:hypothetical protein
MDGRPELAIAWPPDAPMLKGADQGTEGGELDGPLTGGQEVVGQPGDGERQMRRGWR